jgi:hypothetical protein
VTIADAMLQAKNTGRLQNVEIFLRKSLDTIQKMNKSQTKEAYFAALENFAEIFDLASASNGGGKRKTRKTLRKKRSTRRH